MTATTPSSPSPSPLSLMRAGSFAAATSSTNGNSNIISTRAGHRAPSSQLSGADSSQDSRERAIPMTPMLLASLPTQLQQHQQHEPPFQSGGTSSTSSTSSGSTQPGSTSNSYPLRLGRSRARERHTPQWFTAAPLLSQFYAQPAASLLPSTASSQSQHHVRDYHHHHHPGHEGDLSEPSGTPLRAARGYENYHFPSDTTSTPYRQQQQQFRPRRLSHFELRVDETSPLLAAIATPLTGSAAAPTVLSSENQQQQQQQQQEQEHCQQISPPPPKKRKKTAFRLRNFLCMHPGCGKSFTDNAHLRDHTFVHTGEKSLRCELCDKTFARLSTLHDHQRVHSGERPYSCSHPNCEKRYSSRAALRFHLASHAAAGRRGYVTASSSSASIASTAHGGGQLLTASETLMLHRSAAQPESRRSPVLQPGAQQHRDGAASPLFPPPIAHDTLYLHAKIQTQQTQIAELQAELQKLKRKAKKNPPASSSSGTSKPLAATATAPPMTAPVLFLMDGMKPFQCFVCYHRFANFFQLSFHAKQHPDAALSDVVHAQEPVPVGPKFCPEADCEYAEQHRKPLKNLQTLKRHWQRRHQLSRPYVCARCSSTNPKTFKTKENLKAHEKDCKGGGGNGSHDARASVR